MEILKPAGHYAVLGAVLKTGSAVYNMHKIGEIDCKNIIVVCNMLY